MSYIVGEGAGRIESVTPRGRNLYSPFTNLDGVRPCEGGLPLLLSRACLGFKLGLTDPLVIAYGGSEALVRHVSVVVARDGIGRRNALNHAVVVVNLVFYVAL